MRNTIIGKQRASGMQRVPFSVAVVLTLRLKYYFYWH